VSRPVLVVIGVGGMGRAIAARLGSGRRLLLADFDENTLAAAATALGEDGYDVTAQPVDVGARPSVEALAARAAELGEVRTVVHTAGLSPVQAPAEAVMRVDLLGTALVLEAFGAIVAQGGAGLVVASMAAYMGVSLPAEQEAQLASAPADTLTDLPFVREAAASPATAYSFAKRANIVRVRAESLAWGRRGARLNSISPGIVATPMGRSELSGPSGDAIRGMIAMSPTRREGTPGDIAAVADFLLGDAASWITGADLLVDGGVVAAINAPRPA
jgi:NAD(P)-dependent dehydrogenase (short-subunit alcohol dehydrogenase family)